MMECRTGRNSEHYTNPAQFFSHEAAARRVSSTAAEIVVANSQRATCVHPNRECSALQGSKDGVGVCLLLYM